MPRKKLSIALAIALVGALITVEPASAASESTKLSKEAELAEKVKTGISKLGTGANARVELKLRDKAKLAGYVSEVNADSFVVTDQQTGINTTVPYAAVTQIKGHNLGTGAKIAIGIGIGAGIVLIILAIYLNCCTG
jgi:hypothetical protein